MANKVKQVFISHAVTDADFAHRLAHDLKRLGVRVWIAPESIRPNEEWVKAIERGMRESSHVVIVLTPAALDSKWVEKETEVAIAEERKGHLQILPLDVKPCKTPLLLSSYQMISFRRNYDAGLKQLANTLDLRVMPSKPVRAPRQVSECVPAPEVVSPTVVERRQPFEPELILIPAGDFLMGSDFNFEYVQDAERPQHILYLPDYYLAKTPVTNAQYAAFAKATSHAQPEYWKGGKPPKGKEDHPVVNVSWHDVVAYCNWLAQVTGKAYRLPSEAEWEKGARGTDGRTYPWGDEWDPKQCNFEEGGRDDTSPVGAYPQGASPYGLLDMDGNVWEWTRSLWGKKPDKPDFKYPYKPDDGRENLKAGNDVRRVLRGGSWYYIRRAARCAFRFRCIPDDFDDDVGFRVCVASRQE